MKLASHHIPGLDEQASQWVYDAGSLLAQVTGARQVLLFGSLARGEGNPDSDADFCCVVPDGTNLKKAAGAAQRAFLQRKRPMDFYLIEESRYRAGETLLAREIRSNAISIFVEQAGE